MKQSNTNIIIIARWVYIYIYIYKTSRDYEPKIKNLNTKKKRENIKILNEKSNLISHRKSILLSHLSQASKKRSNTSLLHVYIFGFMKEDKPFISMHRAMK